MINNSEQTETEKGTLISVTDQYITHNIHMQLRKDASVIASQIVHLLFQNE